MNPEHLDPNNPQMKEAINGLQELIRVKYPDAKFEVAEGEDPAGLYIWTTVDTEDTDQVLDVVVDRLLDLQVEQGLPVHVIPIRPIARVLAGMQKPVRPRADFGDVKPAIHP